MAVYEKLLLSAGGGIVSSVQQAEQVTNTATILIGLGGTGIDCLRTIKTQVYSRLKPDDPNAPIATYQHIRFLGVDTVDSREGGDTKDNKPLNEEMSLAASEFFPIGNPNLKMALAQTHVLKDKREISWLEWDKITAPSLGTAGAGGKRQVGRYMMMDKSRQFMSRLQTEIKNAMTGLQGPAVNIHIFSGLSGGTGAGCFLDVCYLVQYIARSIQNVTVFGYFFLPDVNLDRVPAADTASRSFIRVNGYSSLQELDYCMQLQFNGGGFTQEYANNLKIDWKGPPVDMCHLICATDSQGNVIPDAYNYAMNVTAEYLMDFLTRSQNDNFDISQQLSNFVTKIGVADGRKDRGWHVEYCAIGAACASLPLREINTYLVSELFHGFDGILGKTPNEADCEQFFLNALAVGARTLDDVYDKISEEMYAGIQDYNAYTGDCAYVIRYTDADMVKHYTDQSAAMLRALATNQTSLAAAANADSLIGRLRSALKEVTLDLDKGPMYAYRLLSAAAQHSVLNLIDGLIAQNKRMWTDEAQQAASFNRNYTSAQASFREHRQANKAKAAKNDFEAYEYAIVALEEHKIKIEVYEHMDKLLVQFKQDVTDLASGRCHALNTVMTNLLQTFLENRANLQVTLTDHSPKNSFVLPLINIQSMKNSLNAMIKDLNIKGMFRTFMETMLQEENTKVWMEGDENGIAQLVTQYFSQTAFHDYANRTITAFLMDTYNINPNNPQANAQLANQVYTNWIVKLTGNANPLFYNDVNLWAPTDISSLAFISVPQSSAPLQAAAKMMEQADPLWKVKESALTDRIYVMHTACAMPLGSYGYCSEYEKEYFSTYTPDRHYYAGKPQPDMLYTDWEGKQTLRFDDWNKLPSLTPQSLMNVESLPPDLVKMTNHAREVFDDAMHLKLIQDDGTLLHPNVAAIRKLEEQVSQCEKYAAQMTQVANIDTAQEMLEALSGQVEVPLEPMPYSVRNVGDRTLPDVKLRIQKDIFVSSPVLVLAAESAVKALKPVRERLEKARETLENRIREIRQESDEISDYCNALFTGVILFELPKSKMTYKPQDPFSEYDETKLCAWDDKAYPFYELPLYQGLLNYKIMPQELKAEIKDAVKSRVEGDDSAIADACRKLLEAMDGDRLRSMVAAAKSLPQADHSTAFLKLFRDKLMNFVSRRGIF